MITDKKKAGVIYLGSRALYMKLAEKQIKGKYKVLENLYYPINFGTESFNKGNITSDKVKETIRIMKGFIKILSEYKVDEIKAVATTAIKEADNKDYIIDQIYTKTDIKVDILNDYEEKNYIYKMISRRLDDRDQLREAQNVLAYIGTGSIGVGLYRGGNIYASQHKEVGSLKLSEILKGIQNRTDVYYKIVEESISGFSHMLKEFLAEENIKNLIISGKEIDIITKLLKLTNQNNQDIYNINIEKFYSLYDQIKEKTPDRLINEYNVSSEEAEILLPAMTIYKTILELSEANQLIFTSALLIDVLIQDLLFPEIEERWNNIFNVNAILSSLRLGKKYKYNKDHMDAVELYALKIFDSLKSLHGMGKNERLILQVAAILHDIGKFMNLKKHYCHSYDIIMASNIVGLNDLEKRLVANIARYHSSIIPNIKDSNYNKLPYKERMIISKLSSILRMGDALDKSHSQKIDNIKAIIKDNTLIIKAFSTKDILLEEITFQKKADLFHEVFGLETEFKKQFTKV